MGEERSAKVNDTLLAAKIRFEHAAQVQRSAIVRLHGIAAEVDGTTLMRRAYPDEGPRLALSADALVYCTGRIELDDFQRFSYPPGDIRRSTKYKKFEREVALCLIDDEGDESLDRAFISGAVSPDALPAVPIAPIAYRMAVLEEPVDARLEVRFIKESKNGPPILLVYTNIHNATFTGSYVSYLAPTGKMEDIDQRAKLNPAKLPRVLQYQDAQITVLSYDAATETLRYRVDRPFTQAMIKIQAIFEAYPNVYNFQYE